MANDTIICPCCGQECSAAVLEDVKGLRLKWGSKIDENGESTEYSDSELHELENSYRRQAAEFKGAISPRIDMALQEIAINRLEWKKSISAGDSAGAKRYADSIKVIMEREGMRAGDGKPVETPQIDSIIVGLEKLGMVDQYGDAMASEKLMPLIAKAIMRKYDVSCDVVDAMIFSIINTMSNNNSAPEFTRLPKSAQLTNAGGQLREASTKEERDTMEAIGAIPPMKEN